MRKHVVLVALTSFLVATAIAGRASAEDGPPRSLADALGPRAVWVLRVPLTLTLAPPHSDPGPRYLRLARALAAPQRDDLGRYPDPRLLPIRRFHLESHLEQDFFVGRLPLTSRIVAYLPQPQPRQTLALRPAPIWQSDLVLRLPRDAYAGGAVEQRTIAPKSFFVVAGQRF
ncbi:MAG: hypothetical protein FWD17_11140 [Polyangiaceae bacterium]|nr:hypothetical protein [Polyangiaceae bacterium]